MMKVLIDNKIPGNVGIAIEFKIPNTSKRVDFIITGKDGGTRLAPQDNTARAECAAIVQRFLGR